MAERSVQADIMRELGRGSTRVFRNHVARGWTGEVVDQAGGMVTLRNARAASFGLAPGSADLVGWRTVRIPPTWVGEPVAVFLSIEAKDRAGRVTAEQRNWMEVVQRAGGFAGIARSADEARIIAGLLT